MSHHRVSSPPQVSCLLRMRTLYGQHIARASIYPVYAIVQNPGNQWRCARKVLAPLSNILRTSSCGSVSEFSKNLEKSAWHRNILNWVIIRSACVRQTHVYMVNDEPEHIVYRDSPPARVTSSLVSVLNLWKKQTSLVFTMFTVTSSLYWSP